MSAQDHRGHDVDDSEIKGEDEATARTRRELVDTHILPTCRETHIRRKTGTAEQQYRGQSVEL